MERLSKADGLTALSAEEYWQEKFSASHQNGAIVKASLLFHLVLGAFFIAWMVWDSHRPAPRSTPFVELVEVGPQAPPAPVTKPSVEPAPLPPQINTEPTPQIAQAQPSPPLPKPVVSPTPQAVVPTTPSKQASAAEPVVQPSSTAPQEESTSPSEEMALPTFAKQSTAPSAAGVIGRAGDPRVNVYNSQIRAAVEPRWRPPAVEGVSPGARAVVSFVIDRSGNQEKIKLQSSSGNQLLDQLALRAVTLARFPPLPAAITEDPYSVQYGFVYEGG